jgi:hypothetical protein
MDHTTAENHLPQTLSGERDERQPYEAPVLVDHGTVAELTLGTFAGVGADAGIYS